MNDQIEQDIAAYRKRKTKEYKKAWRERNKDKIAEYNRQYNESHKEQRKQNRLKRLAENPDYEKAARKKFNQNHPGKEAEYQRNRYWRDHDKALEYRRKRRTAAKAKKNESSND